MEVPAAGRLLALPQDGDKVILLQLAAAPKGARWRHAGRAWAWHSPKLIVAGFADPLQVDLAGKVAEVFLGGGLRALEQAGGVLVGQVERAAAVDPL